MAAIGLALVNSFPSGRKGIASLLLRMFTGTAYLFHGSGKTGELEAFSKEFGVPAVLAGPFKRVRRRAETLTLSLVMIARTLSFRFLTQRRWLEISDSEPV